MTRHQFIPVRKSDIVRALAEKPCGGADAFSELCRLLGMTLHYEFFDELERLKEAYFPFDPKVAVRVAPPEAAYGEFLATLRRVLDAANFTEVPAEEVERAYRERGMLPVEVRAPITDYRDIRFFRRGQHRERIETQSWFGFRRHVTEGEVYTDVVVVAACRTHLPAEDKRDRHWLRKPRPPAGAVFLKFFNGIASADLNTLLPDVRVVMNQRDRWILGLPALFGAVPLLLKLVPTLAILFLLAGIRLGYTGAVEQDQLKQALAVTTGVIALGSFMLQQWVKYQRTALRYQLAIKDSIYFRNVNNNAGLFDALVGAAEEQEFKEAVLAYHFLEAEPTDKGSLDRRIEGWLKERFTVDVDFEVDDGLAKLERFGLLTRSGDRLAVVTPAEALQRLDRRWDSYFRFVQPTAA